MGRDRIQRAGVFAGNPEHRAFLRFISSAEPCEFDNQGRILIPFRNQTAGIARKLYLPEGLTNLEIWDKSAWDKQAEQDMQNYPKIMETIASTGL